MNSNLFDVHVDAQMCVEAELENVEVSVSYPDTTMRPSANGGATFFKRVGKLSIKTREFLGWSSAEVIWLTDKKTGQQSRFEVSPHSKGPCVDGDWITFPVSPQ